MEGFLVIAGELQFKGLDKETKQTKTIDQEQQTDELVHNELYIPISHTKF